jgi:hypothetical protein
MPRRPVRPIALAGLALAILPALAAPALAGPPLLCHPFEIGDARSLPWGGPRWRDVAPDYDVSRLADDTVALLGPETPVLARMETLRRAAVYAVWSTVDREVGYTPRDPRAADELLARLVARARAADRDGRPGALALFDAGYLLETYRQAGYDPAGRDFARGVDGYAWVTEAGRRLGGEPEVEFAAALVAAHPRRAAYRAHLDRAAAGAPDGSLLARNLARYTGP